MWRKNNKNCSKNREEKKKKPKCDIINFTLFVAHSLGAPRNRRKSPGPTSRSSVESMPYAICGQVEEEVGGAVSATFACPLAIIQIALGEPQTDARWNKYKCQNWVEYFRASSYISIYIHIYSGYHEVAHICMYILQKVVAFWLGYKMNHQRVLGCVRNSFKGPHPLKRFIFSYALFNTF